MYCKFHIEEESSLDKLLIMGKKVFRQVGGFHCAGWCQRCTELSGGWQSLSFLLYKERSLGVRDTELLKLLSRS